jgi:hypothetical protein
LFTQGEFPVLVGSPEVQEYPWGHALQHPSLRRTHLYENLPYNIIYTNTPIVHALAIGLGKNGKLHR